jgi:hypothetical protein
MSEAVRLRSSNPLASQLQLHPLLMFVFVFVPIKAAARGNSLPRPIISSTIGSSYQNSTVCGFRPAASPCFTSLYSSRLDGKRGSPNHAAGKHTTSTLSRRSASGICPPAPPRVSTSELPRVVVGQLQQVAQQGGRNRLERKR